MENWKAIREEDSRAAVDEIPPLQEDTPDKPANNDSEVQDPETADRPDSHDQEAEPEQYDADAEEYTEHEEAEQSNEDEGEGSAEDIHRGSRKGGSAQARFSGEEKKHSHQYKERLSLLTQPDPTEKDAVLRNMKETATTLIEKECAAEDVIKVWESLCRYITFKMKEGKAVRIAGLGTFTALLVKTPVNQKTVKVVKTPVFLLSEYVVKMYGLQQERAMTSNIPVVPMNPTVLAIDCNLSRGMVDGIITEILQSFARGIVCNKSVELPFPFIGKLQVKNRQVKMRFYTEFCKKLGFNSAQSNLESYSTENFIPGRMTPLRLHIPSEQYRSVFHLREVRSVHENPLLVPLVRVGEKLVPATIIQDFKEPEFVSDLLSSEGSLEEEEEEDEDENENLPDEEAETPEDNEEADEGEEGLEEASETKPEKMATSAKPKRPLPLYQPQTTGDCVLNMMNAHPDIMRSCLRSNLYKYFIDTLGAKVVKSHLRRRPCPLDRDFPSFENLGKWSNAEESRQSGVQFEKRESDIEM